MSEYSITYIDMHVDDALISDSGAQVLRRRRELQAVPRVPGRGR
jgi:hypothetical protein